MSKGIDAMVASIEVFDVSETKRDRQHEYQQERREKFSVEKPDTPSSQEKEVIESIQEKSFTTIGSEDAIHDTRYEFNEEPMEEERILSYERKITVLYELLSASLATMSDENKKSKQRKGYDARHRVALRLLATWLDIKWVKVVSTFDLFHLNHFISATRHSKFVVAGSYDD